VPQAGGQRLRQAHRGGGLALAQRGGGDGRHIDVPASRGVTQPLQNLGVVNLGQLLAHRQQLPVG